MRDGWSEEEEGEEGGKEEAMQDGTERNKRQGRKCAKEEEK